jgi:hypothetical protein
VSAKSVGVQKESCGAAGAGIDSQAHRPRATMALVGGRSAASRSCECSAHSVHAFAAELGDRLGQECLGHGAEVVQANRALDGHPSAGPSWTSESIPRMVRVTSATTTLRSRGERLVAGEDHDGSAAFVLVLEPDDLAASYQGSSRIASRAF